MKTTWDELDRSAHLWLAEAGAGAPDAAALDLLSPDERQRWEAIRPPRGRAEFAAGRALLRTTLSRYAGRDPRSWRFRAGPRGRPALADPDDLPELSFNLAHAAGLVACVVARGCAAGVDVEHPERRVDVDALTERFFAPGERERILAARGVARREVFFAYWTLKEAYLKATGVGIGVPLKSVAFAWTGDRVRPAFPPALDERPDAWQLDLLRGPRGHWVATALRVGDGPARAVVAHGASLTPIATSR